MFFSYIVVHRAKQEQKYGRLLSEQRGEVETEGGVTFSDFEAHMQLKTII